MCFARSRTSDNGLSRCSSVGSRSAHPVMLRQFGFGLVRLGLQGWLAASSWPSRSSLSAQLRVQWGRARALWLRQVACIACIQPLPRATWRLTIHSSRSRFAARLNSGVICGPAIDISVLPQGYRLGFAGPRRNKQTARFGQHHVSAASLSFAFGPIASSPQ